MGIAQYTINIPINKGASGIVCLDKQESKSQNTKLLKPEDKKRTEDTN